SVILEYRSFVNKLVFPLDILPVNLVLAGLVTEAVGLVIFLAGLLAVRHSIPESAIWLPLLLIPQVLLAAGLGWLLSATGVFVRDLGQLIGFLLTLWFFLTPIGYEESKFASLPGPVGTILSMNPILILVRGYRTILLENHAPWMAAHAPAGLLWLWGLSILVAVLGYGWFNRLRKNFADVV
ncbi:MAG: ABC transporter permease, partial [Acidobacteriota bacterium]